MRNHTGMERLTFGDWLRGMRSRHGEMTQQALADATGLQRSYIVRIERGGVKLPNEETRARFHAVFGTTEADLEQLGIVPRYDEWGRVIPGDAQASGGRVVALDESAGELPSRDVTADLPDERDNSPLTAAELDELKDAMFYGFNELEPADLREVIAVMRRRRKR